MTLTRLVTPWTVGGASVDLPLIKCPLQQNQWYEAPATWVVGNTIWLMYSRCNTGPNYELMLAYCNTTDDVLNASSWHMFKQDPVIVGNGGDDTGPGHNGWFYSPDRAETWIVYHGTVGEQGRSSRAMRVRFDSAGQPSFDVPPPIGQQIPEPSTDYDLLLL